MRISDWSSDVFSSDLKAALGQLEVPFALEDGVRVVLSMPRLWARCISLLLRVLSISRCLWITQYVTQNLTCNGSWYNSEIGRASCRERVGQYVEFSVVAVSLKKKK